MLSTIEEIAQDVVSQLTPLDLKGIACDFRDRGQLEGMWLKTSFQREIRNEYSLWYENPLTERWRTDESSHDIRDGVDYSEDHPDNISAVIYNRIVELAKEKSNER